MKLFLFLILTLAYSLRILKELKSVSAENEMILK